MACVNLQIPIATPSFLIPPFPSTIKIGTPGIGIGPPCCNIAIPANIIPPIPIPPIPGIAAIMAALAAVSNAQLLLIRLNVPNCPQNSTS